MSRRAAPFLAVALLLLAAGCGKGGGTVDLLPADRFEGVWNRSGAAETFGPGELYNQIDGGAEVFLELGFERLDVQRYQAPAGEVSVEVYRMSDPAAALGIYLMKCGQETPAQGLDSRSTAGPYQVQLVRGSSYVAVNRLAGGDEAAAVLVAMARHVEQQLPAAPAPDLFAVLPSEGRVAGSERVIRGQFTMDPIFTLGEGNVLLLGRQATAVAATYRSANGEPHTRLVASYPDAAAARAAFANLRSKLDPQLKVLESAGDRVSFRDFADKLGEVSVREAQIQAELGKPE